MQINIKKLVSEAVLPFKIHNTDVGLDLTAVSKKIVDNKDHGYIEYGTGLSMSIPEGFGGFIFPRSSISKTGHIQANAVGIIDPSYRGEVTVRFKHIKDSKEYDIDDKIAQLVIMPFEPNIEWNEVDDLDETERGSGSYGSTGK